MWDVRARTFICELATGNNSVTSLAWDAGRSTLFAATECDHMDSRGNFHGYRRARIPKWAERVPIAPGTEPEGHGRCDKARSVENRMDDEDEDEDEDMDEDEDDEDDDDDDDNNDDYGERCWPKGAYHDETSFGYALDSGENMICESR